MDTTLKLYALDFKSVRTYLIAALFVAGNVLLPFAFHTVPNGGIVWLPILFFTLIGGYKYGWKVGIITAIFSPLISTLLVGMPVPAVLPLVMVKSLVLALAAGLAAHYFKKLSLILLAGVILVAQLIGTTLEGAILGDFALALKHVQMGLPGMLMQLFGGMVVLNYILKK